MTVSIADQERVIRLLIRDVRVAIGDGHEGLVSAVAAWFLPQAANVDEYVNGVVDGVQQELHDSYINTTWPRSPQHPHHPLWFHDDHWWCERDKTRERPRSYWTFGFPWLLWLWEDGPSTGWPH
jgi:hypothetical protein